MSEGASFYEHISHNNPTEAVFEVLMRREDIRSKQPKKIYMFNHTRGGFHEFNLSYENTEVTIGQVKFHQFQEEDLNNNEHVQKLRQEAVSKNKTGGFPVFPGFMSPLPPPHLLHPMTAFPIYTIPKRMKEHTHSIKVSELEDKYKNEDDDPKINKDEIKKAIKKAFPDDEDEFELVKVEQKSTNVEITYKYPNNTFFPFVFPPPPPPPGSEFLFRQPMRPVVVVKTKSIKEELDNLLKKKTD